MFPVSQFPSVPFPCEPCGALAEEVAYVWSPELCFTVEDLSNEDRR